MPVTITSVVRAHAFSAALTPDATLSDDGTEQDLTHWADQEVHIEAGQA
jgi:hypothetical protein